LDRGGDLCSGAGVFCGVPGDHVTTVAVSDLESSDRVSTDTSSVQSQDQTSDDPVSLTRARPDEASAEIQVDVEAATPDPVEAFQAQLIRNEEILRQLREGELTRSQDQ